MLNRTTRIGLLAALLVLMTGCETLQTIDKGLYTAAESVTERDRVTGRRTLSLEDRQQQIATGNKRIKQFLAAQKKAGKRINEDYDAKAYERIQRIFERVHQVSHLRDEDIKPILLEGDEWNAFTTGGSYLVVYSGLERDLQDDAELGNVIAHELAHISANHAFEAQGTKTLSILTGSKAARRDTYQAAFSHEQEAEADRIAVLYSALAGYDPYAGQRVWERMYQKLGDNADMIHDHPMNSERAVMARRAASKVEKYYTPDWVNFDHEAILESNPLFSRDKTQVAAGEGGGLLAVLDVAAETYVQKYKAKNEERRQLQRVQFMRSVHQLTQVVHSTPVGPNAWRFTLAYRGNRPLTDLTFKGMFPGRSGKPMILTKRTPGILRPNSTFQVVFESPQLSAYSVHPNQARFGYETVRSF